jgi:DNA-binding HxlR family transcriptional regulator
VKSYKQYCPVAHALDLVGDRWALLVVRELMLGPRRYTDLAEALPGIGSNILATRLRSLESAGVVRKTKLPPPAAVSVYELTENGRALDDVLHALARWGARTLPAPDPEDCWSIYAVHARFRPELAVDGVYEIRFEEEAVVSLHVRDGQLATEKGSAAHPTLVVEIAPATLHELVYGSLSVRSVLADGRARIPVGSQADLRRLVAMFAPVEPGAAAEAAA